MTKHLKQVGKLDRALDGWIASEAKSCEAFFPATSPGVDDHHKGKLMAEVQYQKQSPNK
jgi:hypothetical protein